MKTPSTAEYRPTNNGYVAWEETRTKKCARCVDIEVMVIRPKMPP